MTDHRYTEQAVADFFDTQGDLYRTFWDPEGSMHWGLFHHPEDRDFQRACRNLDRLMLQKAALGPEHRLLDLGCGNGNTAIWLARQAGAEITGIDLSQVQVNHAASQAQEEKTEVLARLCFRRASATNLPYPPGRFSHVWSQATLHRIPEPEQALAEARRVLQPRGLLVFDALTSPREGAISPETRRLCYDRLLCDTSPSFLRYHQLLEAAGFRVLESRDLSQHLARSYELLQERATEQMEQAPEQLAELAAAYRQMVQAVQAEELGWGLFVARKR